MKPYFSDSTVTLWHGANLDVLPHLADGSVDCVVTSPPYFGLRSYLPEDHPDKPLEFGAEPTPAEFVANLVATFAEIRRVLADDATVWLNLGDSYSQKIATNNNTPNANRAGHSDASNRTIGEQLGRRRLNPDVPAKNLLGMPWRTAFALQDDGWILRNAIVWHAPNKMPESVTDRLSTRYEMVFMFSKSRRYWFDLDPIRESTTSDLRHRNAGSTGRYAAALPGGGYANHRDCGVNPDGRNPGDVWTIPTTPFSGSHFAVFPPEIPRRCILAGCTPKTCVTCGKAPVRTPDIPSEGITGGWTDCGHNNWRAGTVLDPFHGSGTTGMVAQRLGRKYVGIELNKDYLDLSLRTRLADGALPFDEETA